MTKEFWGKLNYYFGMFALAAIVAVGAHWATVEIKDLDLWLHIATGRFIVQNGFVPLVDVLSNSIAGQVWSNHE